jgi:hypothetical protein
LKEKHNKRFEPAQLRRYYEQALGDRIRKVRSDEAACLCPFHADHAPSLSVNFVNGLFNCHTGCGGGDVVAFEQRLHGGSRQMAAKRIEMIVAVESVRRVRRIYLYPKHRHVIIEHYSCAAECGCDQGDKRHRTGKQTFWQKQIAGGAWINGLAGVQRLPYKLDELSAKKGHTIWAVESLEDVNTLLAHGLRAISMKDPWHVKWFHKYISGEKVGLVVWPDKDSSGTRQAKTFANKAQQSGVFDEIRWAEPPADWPDGFDATKAARILRWELTDFERLLKACKQWNAAGQRPAVEQKGQSAKVKQDREVVAESLLLTDGRHAEIVENNGRVVFTIFLPGKDDVELADRIEVAGQVYVPRSNSLILAGALVLPPVPDFSAGEDPMLFDDLRGFVRKYWVGSEHWIRTVVLYVLLTWITHTLNEVAYLRIIGDLGSAKSRFCDVLQFLCYRAVRAAGNITKGALPRLLTSYPDATLVMDEADLHGEDAAEIRQILRCGSSRRTPVIKCCPGSRPGEWEPAAFSVFGPKVIAARKATKDDALETRCITQAVAKAKDLGEVPITLPPQFWQEAAVLRARLMAFRVFNFGCAAEFRQAIAESERTLLNAGLDYRTVQLGAPLYSLSQMLNQSIATQSCFHVLRHYDVSVRLERGQGLDGVLCRYVEHLREKCVVELQLSAFLSGLKAFAEENDDFDPQYIPKKQGLSRRLNTLAHILGIRLKDRTSGHADRAVVILPPEPEGNDSAPIHSVPIKPAESGVRAQAKGTEGESQPCQSSEG